MELVKLLPAQGKGEGKLHKVRKKAKIRNRCNQVSHLTQDTTWESDKITKKHHTQESQEASPFSAGNHKATMNRWDSMADMKLK